MPEVKWVHTQSLHDAEELMRLCSVLDGVQPYMVPVLTLDQIKAWLENVPTATPGEISPALWRNGRESFKCDLLAQVQAWRTQPTTPGASHE